jgi:hypothetical protein
METFKIEIQELLSKVVEVQAENISEVFSKVNDQYKSAEIVLDYNDFVEMDFIDINTQSKSNETKNLIKEVVDYLYKDEKNHFEENNNSENHIYTKLERLKILLE